MSSFTKSVDNNTQIGSGNSTIVVGGVLNITNNTPSALLVVGGASVGANLSVSGTVSSAGVLLATTTNVSTSISSAVTTLQTTPFSLSMGTRNMVIGTTSYPNSSTGSGYDNISIGNNQLKLLSTGYNNIAVGVNNLTSVTSGNYNSVCGTLSLNNITTARGNSSFGVYNLNALTGNNASFGSNSNSSFGSSQYMNLTSGSFNCGLGDVVFQNLVEGSNNTGVGYGAGVSLLGSNNTCIGSNSGQGTSDMNVYNHSSCIGRDSKISASNQIMLGSNTDTVVCPASLSVTGALTATQMIEPFLITPYTTTPTFNMTSGMIYYLATTSTPINSLGFTNIPSTGQTSTIFSFILLPSTANNPYFLRPGTNFINVTPVGGVITSVPVFGFGNILLPASYTYLLQQVTIVNTSTTSLPTYIAFTSVSGY